MIPIGLLQRPPVPGFLLLALRSWRLLLTLLYSPWLLSLFHVMRPWCLLFTMLYGFPLLSLFLLNLAAPLRRGVVRGRLLHVFTTPLLWLRTLVGRSLLPERR